VGPACTFKRAFFQLFLRQPQAEMEGRRTTALQLPGHRWAGHLRDPQADFLNGPWGTQKESGWWFGFVFIFPYIYIGNNNPN